MEIKDNKIIWNIKKFPADAVMLLKFTCDYISPKLFFYRGDIEANFISSHFSFSGISIDKYDAYTRNKFYVDTLERDDEPGTWDCKLVFENPSEFVIQLFNADVYSPDDESIKYVDIDPKDVPLLPAGAQWHSKTWKYESEDYPAFKKKLEFRVMPDFHIEARGKIKISVDNRQYSSISGEVSYDKIQVPTYKETNINATLKILNDGTVPLNEIIIEQHNFTDEFQPPNFEEITLNLDGFQSKIQKEAIKLEKKSFKIIFKDLKGTAMGLFLPNAILEFQYPLHCINPSPGAVFKPDIKILVNTYPIGELIEYFPSVKTIEALHLRRKFRIGKRIVAIGDLGQYQINLYIENIGKYSLHNLVLLDKVPDSFEYSDYSMKPQITDELGQDTLKWVITTLQARERIEVSYEIAGSGKYYPSDAQFS